MCKEYTLTHAFGRSEGMQVLDTSSISFPIRNDLLGRPQIINVNVDFFKVVLTEVSSYLNIDRSEILKLKFNGLNNREGMVIKDFQLTTYDNPYQLLINHNAILDCTDLSQDHARLDFSVQFSLYGILKELNYSVNLKLVKAKPTCKVQFVPNESLLYAHEDIGIGHLEINNDCQYRYAEMASMALTLQYPKEFLENIVSFARLNELTETNPYYENAGLKEKDDKISSCLIKKRLSNQKLELRKIVAQNTISIPIYLDLSKLDNPSQAEQIREEMFLLYVKNILNDEMFTLHPKVPVSRDNTTTKLYVRCNEINIEDNTKIICGHYNWIHHQQNQMARFAGRSEIVNIKIGNEASNAGISPQSAVLIKNVKVDPVYDRQQIEASTVFLEINDFVDDNAILVNGVDSFITYRCRFLHKNVSDIPSDYVTIKFVIEFDYIEDENGEYEEGVLQWKKYHAEAIVELEKDPGPKWLCVDYGTSATVAVFGDGDTEQRLLTLNARNKEILLEKESNEKFRSPRFEEGDVFLSSNIMFSHDPLPALDSDSMKNSLVYLSPSEPRFHNARSLRLPYLKALVGYKDIPNAFVYKDFEYKIKSDDETSVLFKDKPLLVDDVFTATYRSLLRDYIKECIPEDNDINKIVLTVPNTYTPHHIKHLKNLVKKEIDSLREDYIWFVSESDAIAYYYLRNWNRFNSYRHESVDGQKENVLVFDMGAGTLDVTCLSIEHRKSGENVSIVSKLGLNKAGNYLDYIIAKVLVELYPDTFKPAMLQHVDDDLWQNLLGKLKFFIKSSLKPVLFKEDQTSVDFSAWNGQQLDWEGQRYEVTDLNLDLKQIREHTYISNFISECTDQLFDRLMSVAGMEQDDFMIDTLIMAGRSIQFGNIKDRLRECINRWNDDDLHCHTVEIVGEELKTIVSQGAIFYAALYGKKAASIELNNRNIFAKYGVLYMNNKGKWLYQPLLDFDTQPTGRSLSSTGQRNGMQIYTYDTDRYSADVDNNYIVLNLSSTINAYLVQCYSTDPAKDFEDEEKRHDYITIMASFSPESVAQDTTKVHVRLEIDENNEMTFTAGNLTFEATAPVKIDVEKNNTFKHSMWPYA